MLNKRQKKHLSTVAALLTALCLFVGILPAPAYAVTQEEINALERRRDEIAAKTVITATMSRSVMATSTAETTPRSTLTSRP